ncbi:hypothetical protein TrLO_g3297 [Triparma laevis f. longispina]|uniref:Tyrosine-protein kinase ephrin type A/B receptor-like domain-containing protein n=1 Tax=Triparma laevis f. longispina TaxID=1714387 RepID=A0A9W7FS97_9STRA|nr:hypothetical protein TrLO_g3297 [Triparma laevis f. longispina]
MIRGSRNKLRRFRCSEPGASTRYTCTPGKFTSADQTECLLCPAGKISGVAASSCTVCEEGKYAENEGNTECKFCDDDKMLVGSTTLQNGTTSANGCICPAGEYVQFSENTCQKVPEGVETTINVMTDGYASTGSGVFLVCSACEGGDAATTIAVGFGAFFFILLLAMALTCCIRKKKRRRREDDNDDRAGLSNKDSLATNTNRVNKELSKIDIVLSFYSDARPYGKIMLSYLQIVGSLSFNLDIGFPPMFTTLMSMMSSVVNVEFLNMMPLGCVINSNFHHTLVVYTLVPFLTGIAMTIAYVILKRSGKVEASNTVFGWFLFMTFLILPSVSTKLSLSSGLVVLGPGTLSQIIISMLICLAAMRIFAGCKPYIKDKVDKFSELAQWQIFFVMLAALLLIVAGMSEDFEIENKGAFDVILLLIQGLVPTVLVVMVLIKGKEVVSLVARKGMIYLGGVGGRELYTDVGRGGVGNDIFG